MAWNERCVPRARAHDPQTRPSCTRTRPTNTGIPGACGVCVAVKENGLTSKDLFNLKLVNDQLHRVTTVETVEHKVGHLNSFYSRVFGIDLQLEPTAFICLNHYAPYLKEFTQKWKQHLARKRGEENGLPVRDSTEHVELITMIYPDEALPVRASCRALVAAALQFQQRAHKELHLVKHGAAVPFRGQAGARAHAGWLVENRAG